MDPLEHAGAQPNGLDPMAGRPIRHAGVHGPDDLSRQRRVADQRRPASPRRDVLGGTAHVDVHAVEAQLAGHLGHLVELVRIGAVDLRGDRPLDLSVLELLPGRLAAVADLVHVDELGDLHIRLAVPRHDEPEGRIGHPVHGREADDRLRNVVPEAHRRDGSTARPCSQTASRPRPLISPIPVHAWENLTLLTWQEGIDTLLRLMKGVLTMASQVRIPDSIAVHDLQGELLLLNPATGVCVSLDPMGTRMWELIQDHHTLHEVLDALLHEYDVTEAQCAHDLLSFVARMLEERFIETGDVETS